MKIAVFGAAGRMGSMHAHHLLDMGHTVIGFDPVAPGWYLHPDDGIPEDCDGVVIATPANMHLGQLHDAIVAGKHVFVEKPLCLIGETGVTRSWLNRAEEMNLVVATGYNLRFHPKVMVAKTAIMDGIIKPLWGSFLLRQKPARPVQHFLEEWASHEVDLANHLLGGTGTVRLRQSSDNMIEIYSAFHAEGASLIHVDALSERPRRAFTIVDQDGIANTFDIETDHVHNGHYFSELNAWIGAIQGEGMGFLASGRDGLAAIELLERVTQ